MPILFIGYIIAYLDRVNVGFAKLQMMGDLKFSDGVYGFGAGIFFLGYFFFEIPSNLILHKVGARVWICRVLVTWGIVSGCTAFVRTPWEFYTVRFLLGLAEAGFFPGMILYLTYWFPAKYRGRVISTLFIAQPVANAAASIASAAILEMDGVLGIKGWQWIFIIEAIPAVLLGLFILRIMTDRPSRADWLPGGEKNLLEGTAWRG